jgi:hypothetical protein
MSRQSTLLTVRNMVKAECGKSLDPSSTAQDAEINQIIANTQALLAADYDWHFLKSRWDSFLSPATRFQTFPTTLSPQGGAAATTAVVNFERPCEMLVKWNMIWQPVLYGIDEYPEFNYLDADRNQVLDPVQRWQFSDETNFEVWPLPAGAAQVRFVGQRQLTTLQSAGSWNDSALLDMDDLLVAFYVAAEYAAREAKPNAKTLFERAQNRLMAIRGASLSRSQTITIGRGQPLGRKAIRNVPMVVVAGK